MKTDELLKKLNDQFVKSKKNALLTIFIGGGIILISPILFTRVGFDCINFSHSGEIGDTIGGITAPIVGFVAALLVYFSFNAQLKANQIQIIALNQEKDDRIKDKETQDRERIYSHLQDLIKNLEEQWNQLALNKGIENLDIIIKKSREFYSTSAPLDEYIKYVEKFMPKIQQLSFVLNYFNKISKRVQEKNILIKDDKNILLLRISFFYTSNLNWTKNFTNIIDAEYIKADQTGNLIWINTLQGECYATRTTAKNLGII